MIASRFTPDRKSTRLNSSHPSISYAVFCLKKKIPNLLCFQVVYHLLSQLGDALFVLSLLRGDYSAVFAGYLAFLLMDLIGSLFFFNVTATTEIYTLSLHDALPI